jgi:hypothetical protein
MRVAMTQFMFSSRHGVEFVDENGGGAGDSESTTQEES